MSLLKKRSDALSASMLGPHAVSALPALDIRQLQYFMTLAEHGSISSAAAALRIAQPSLSENLKRMESKLGVSLAIRSERGIVLTEAGQVLARRGQEILDAAVRAIDEVRHAGKEARELVSIGLPPSLGLLLSVPLAETIQAEYRGVRLYITEGMSGDIAEWIAKERLDLGYVFDITNEQDLLHQPLMRERLFFITAPDNIPPFVNCDDPASPRIRVRDLEGLPLTLPALPHGARRVIERFARGAGISLNVALEIDSLPQIIAMTTRASTYTVLPQAAVTAEVMAGTLRLIEIVEPAMTRTSYLVRKRSRPITEASQAVQRSIRVIMREIIERFQLDAAIIDEAAGMSATEA